MPNLTSNSPKRHGHQGNRKIAQVRYKNKESYVDQALGEGFEISTDWIYSPIMTVKQARLFVVDLRRCEGYDVDWTLNVKASPLPSKEMIAAPFQFDMNDEIATLKAESNLKAYKL